jgi:hypothetical protein
MAVMASRTWVRGGGCEGSGLRRMHWREVKECDAVDETCGIELVERLGRVTVRTCGIELVERLLITTDSEVMTRVVEQLATCHDETQRRQTRHDERRQLS